LEAAAVLIVGADPDFSHPVLAQKLKKAVTAGGTSLVLMAPYATGLSRFASCEIRHKPGEERKVLDSLGERLGGGDPPGLRQDVERAAQALNDAKKKGPVVVALGSGIMRRRDGSTNLKLATAVAHALSAKVLPLLSAANDRGAIEMASFFGCDGLTTPEIYSAAREGRLDLLYLIGDDLPPGNYDAKFVIVQDMFLPSEVGRIADVVFPAASFTEVDGTYTNMEGRVQRVRGAARRVLGSMPDCEILSRLAGKLEKSGFESGETSEVMAEVAKKLPFYKGATHDALDDGAYFGAAKAHKSGRFAATARTIAPKPEVPDKDHPFLLVAELDEYSYRATPLSSQVPGLGRLERAGTVTLSPADAEAAGVETGMPVSVVSRRGKAIAHAVVSESAQDGVVRMVARGGDGLLAVLLDGVHDRGSKAPEEICAVRVEKI
jgi:predicted molibdopterin-dependent oxidoreductase YjgC